MDVFGYPYWMITVKGELVPRVPSSLADAYAPAPPVPPELLPQLNAIPAPGMEGTPFFEVIVKNCPLGGSMIVWGLKRTFADPGPYYFELYWAETPTGELTKVDTPALYDTYWAVDPEQRTWALDLESYYAIRMVTPNGEYWSYAAHANSLWGKKDWLIAREICRKEFLMCRKFTGIDGFLLKRRVWGEPCSRCKDFDTNEPKDGHCEVCFGTGKTGGYWAPFPAFIYSVGAEGPPKYKQVDDNAGLVEPTIWPGMRMLGYPQISTNDVFWIQATGQRCFVRPVNITAEIKGIPIVYTCELRLAPYTDVIYKFPPAPLPPPPPPPPPESEPPPAPPLPVQILWVDGEWRLGAGTFLYSTKSAYPMPNGLDVFTWEPAGLTFNAIGDGYEITGDEAVNGTYYPEGESAGLPVFIKS